MGYWRLEAGGGVRVPLGHGTDICHDESESTKSLYIGMKHTLLNQFTFNACATSRLEPLHVSDGRNIITHCIYLLRNTVVFNFLRRKQTSIEYSVPTVSSISFCKEYPPAAIKAVTGSVT